MVTTAPAPTSHSSTTGQTGTQQRLTPQQAAQALLQALKSSLMFFS